MSRLSYATAIFRADRSAKINQSFINLANMAPQVTDSVPRLVVE